MKCRIFLFLVVCAALIISSCEQKGPLSPGSQELGQSELGPVPDEGLTSLSKVVREEYTFDYDMDWDPPYEDCVTGEPMQNHGLTLVYIRETTTPSGNMTVHGWVDYNAYGGVTLENLGTGDIWTLTNGHNPFGEVIKENGSYLLHYHWEESYTNPDGEKLKIHLKGHVKVDKDGNVTIERESYRCF